jgi:hypothetical protein
VLLLLLLLVAYQPLLLLQRVLRHGLLSVTFCHNLLSNCCLPPVVCRLYLCIFLLQRVRRREFILEHGLLSVRRMQGLEKRRMAGERERTAQMRVFAR